MSTYGRLVHSLFDTDNLIPAQAEVRRRTATGLVRSRTQGDKPSLRGAETA